MGNCATNLELSFHEAFGYGRIIKEVQGLNKFNQAQFEMIVNKQEIYEVYELQLLYFLGVYEGYYEKAKQKLIDDAKVNKI